MQTIQIELTIDEANRILEALGQMPFVRVYALIDKLQDQAKAQLGSRAVDPDKYRDKDNDNGNGAPEIAG